MEHTFQCRPGTEVALTAGRRTLVHGLRGTTVTFLLLLLLIFFIAFYYCSHDPPHTGVCMSYAIARILYLV